MVIETGIWKPKQGTDVEVGQEDRMETDEVDADVDVGREAVNAEDIEMW